MADHRTGFLKWRPAATLRSTDRFAFFISQLNTAHRNGIKLIPSNAPNVMLESNVKKERVLRMETAVNSQAV